MYKERGDNCIAYKFLNVMLRESLFELSTVELIWVLIRQSALIKPRLVFL